MSFWRLVLTSLLHYRRLNAAVAMGAAAATAVLTGALLVGDSVRGSLTAITFDRLGRIDEALVTDRFFRTELADELAATPEFQEYYVVLAAGGDHVVRVLDRAVVISIKGMVSPPWGGDGVPASPLPRNKWGCTINAASAPPNLVTG